MNDPQEPNHWDLLVSELGATPPPRDPETPRDKPRDKPREHEEAAEQRSEDPASGAKGAEARSTTPVQRRPATDWGRLAEQLGIEREEEPDEPSASDAISPSSSEHGGALPEARPMPGEGESAYVDSGGSEGATDAGPSDAAPPTSGPDLQAADLVAESTRTALIPAGAEVELPGFAREAAGAPEKPDETMPERKGGRRRQKPRRPRGRKPAETAAEQPAPESGEQAAGAVAEEAPVLAGPDEEGPEPMGASTEDKRPPDRGKRRRRRGGGRKKGVGGRDGEPGESQSPEELAAQADDSESPQAKRKLDEQRPNSGGRKDVKSEKARKSTKTAHRGIPGWAEAVGIVISTNMESRAKKPSTASFSRSRGGRGRGGRDKSGDKKK